MHARRNVAEPNVAIYPDKEVLKLPNFPVGCMSYDDISLKIKGHVRHFLINSTLFESHNASK